ncbi:type II toxin-antitoxin system HipA family toxin [Microbacterium sp.]|uniref:type II toxin-antitoxin system HipA family toxin n=1 Tax=Microbacterium sp. TaxID=51671 RepID=UPI00356816EF
MTDELEVRLHGEYLGLLRRAPRRSRENVILEDVTPTSTKVRLAESFALRAGRRPDTDLVSRFLGGYLPEGAQRRALASKRAIEPNDLFAFLREFGSSIAGALTFWGQATTEREPRYTPISPKLLRQELQRAIKEHDLGIRDDSRSMIAGFQPKLLVSRFGDSGWSLPHGGGHSTHILKPRLQSRPTRLVDEFYSHELARALGLATFASWLEGSGDGTYLAIERFDRRVHDETVELVHQEDAAQALSLGWADDDLKFQDPERPRDPRRPSAYRIAELTATLRGFEVVEQWVRQLLFRILIGDNDGHAKNVGILHLPGEDRLTDMYDAVPNLFQPERIQWNMALAIDGEFDRRRIDVERLQAEVASWRVLGASRVHDVIDDVLGSFRSALDDVSVPRGGSNGLREFFGRAVDRLRAGDEIGE